MNNHVDFCKLATNGLNKKAAIKVGIALDAAILFGILEYTSGNESLCMPLDKMQKLYDEKLQILRNRAT